MESIHGIVRLWRNATGGNCVRARLYRCVSLAGLGSCVLDAEFNNLQAGGIGSFQTTPLELANNGLGLISDSMTAGMCFNASLAKSNHKIP